MADPPTVTLLGTGTMGAGMARSMRRAGLEVRAWNRTVDKARPLADDGVTVVEDAREAVRGADVVVTMLSNADAVADVAGRVLPAFGDETVWAQMGTIGLEGTGKVAALAREHGVALVDAPVSGTKQPAEEGKLIVLASGPGDARRRAAPVFDAVGSRTVDLGDEPGTGSRMKVVVNTWLLQLVASLAETISLGEGLGLSAGQFLDVIGGGPLDTPYAQQKGKEMAAHDYEVSFTLANADKDAHLSLAAAREAGVELAVTRAVVTLFDTAQDDHRGEDLAAVREVTGRPPT